MRSLSIHTKLIALVTLLMVAVVTFLAVVLSSRQIAALGAELSKKAGTYGRMVASETMSAVAFSDRETAREELQALDADPDVAAVALYAESGDALYARGEVITQVPDELTGVQIVEVGDRIAAVAPVQSIEGPRGVVVVELSTAAMRDARSRVVVVALATGGAALACGVLFAWLVSRRLTARLRSIGAVAAAVTEGDMSRRVVADGARDEIGRLATAFDKMLAEIHRLIEEQRRRAADEQARLEALVAQRTAELDRRNVEMRLVLDHVDQGLMTVDIDGRIAPEHSAAIERWLGPIPESRAIEDYVATFSPDASAWFSLQWQALRDDFLPIDLTISQLPASFVVGGRHLALAYSPIVDGDGRVRVLFVITDTTARIAREMAERDERELSALVTRLLRGRAGFVAFHQEADQLVTRIARGGDDAASRRDIHTLKGIVAFEGLSSIAQQCHALEDALAEGDAVAAAEHRATIAARWRVVTAKLEGLVALGSGHVELMPGDLARIEAAIARGAGQAELLEHVASWRHERVSTRLERFADDARVLAERLGKSPVEVVVDASDALRLPTDAWAPFWASFTHAVRNAVDHGLEAPGERAELGKSSVGRITLRAREAAGELAIEIEDDGTGIDWQRLRRAAEAAGLRASSHDELVACLFHDGITTRATVSSTSGRGVGLAALRDACASRGGTVAVTSERGRGTTVSFRWLRHHALLAARTRTAERVLD